MIAKQPSESVFVSIRGLRYHCRCWGVAGSPLLFMLHGWMDVSASFQFLVDALTGNWRVIAPDWRGYGLTDRGRSDCYWFPDYLADLDALLAHFEPERAATLVGHSMGGNVASLYAGARPERVGTLVNLEGFGLAESDPGHAPERFAGWLRELARPRGFRGYASFADLAERMQAANPRLTAERAAFLARHWGEIDEDGKGVRLRADPAHKIVNPVLYRLAETEACWRNIRARVLWVQGAQSDTPHRLGLSEADLAARRACFRSLVLRTLPDAGHMVHHDQPAALARAIEAFLLS
ncbi:MAG: alpha/beta hydrolase [Burkholderiales bacterium]|nr:alpha/beta hydrolase [Burkholderiales bacterium]